MMAISLKNINDRLSVIESKLNLKYKLKSTYQKITKSSPYRCSLEPNTVAIVMQWNLRDVNSVQTNNFLMIPMRYLKEVSDVYQHDMYMESAGQGVQLKYINSSTVDIYPTALGDTISAGCINKLYTVYY